jgi:hypothetical protein
MMSFLFTGHRGEIFEVTPEDLPLSVPPQPYTSFDGTLAIDPVIELQQVAPEMKPSPLIVVCNVCDKPDKLVAALPRKRGARCLIKAVKVLASNQESLICL